MWDIPPEASISEKEAELFASLASYVDAEFAVETGTGDGTGTRRLRCALPERVRLATVDISGVDIDGVECVQADSSTWVPGQTIDALFVDCAVPRQPAVDNLLKYVRSGGIVVVHDADKGTVDMGDSIIVGRLQIGVA